MAEKPMLGGCCVCLDERGWAENPLVYCDGQACSVAVHQACYGIVKVPSGPWFCRKCESQERAAKVKCELCPHRDGALKRTDSAGWAHVVCALYIPEVTFGSVSTMEPIILQKVPTDRFNKTCYICEEENRSSKAGAGACMTCAKQGCKASFHVTCAQMAGLLCEEASSGNQTKYCGYCKAHLAKGKKTSSAYKNLSSTKVYKLPITSSSDELTSPERSQPYLPESSIMKPGDIRYTKAGKKRSKSLEESLATEAGEDKTVTSLKETTANATSDLKRTDAAQLKNQPTIKSSSRESEHDVLTEINRPEDDNASEEDAEKNELDPAVSSKLTDDTASSSIQLTSDETENSCHRAQSALGSCTGLTLSSLAEAASVVSQSSAELEVPSHTQETAAKKLKIVSKDSLLKKKHRENKKSKIKKSDQEKKRRKTPLSGIMPHRPVPPPITSRDPATVTGTAVYPRHSVVSLAKMGLDRTETYEPHEIGDNNKVFKPDFSVDGVTALEQIQNEQKQDTADFFLKYGTTPEVSALMEALTKVKEDNSCIESAIQQMARRRDQLLLMKTRLMGLQMGNVSVATNPTTQQNNVVQHQINSQVLPSQTVLAPRMSSSPHLPASSQHPKS